MGNHSMEWERIGEAKRTKEVVEGSEKREREERKIEGRESEKNGIDMVTYKEERILKH